MRIPNSFHVSLLKPVIFNRFNRQITPPPAPQADSTDVFEVKEILDTKTVRGRRLFLVDWKGFGPEERSWEPEDNILDKSLLQRFLRPKKRGRPKGGVLSRVLPRSLSRIVGASVLLHVPPLLPGTSTASPVSTTNVTTPSSTATSLSSHPLNSTQPTTMMISRTSLASNMTSQLSSGTSTLSTLSTINGTSPSSNITSLSSLPSQPSSVTTTQNLTTTMTSHTSDQSTIGNSSSAATTSPRITGNSADQVINAPSVQIYMLLVLFYSTYNVLYDLYSF
ncbi:hypothetical protein GDO81_019806 [Engystomops pustulosus]|uniref:Chromo domain-containing protein n=1 Tax=Engystomops pustulosus TaxID=76066 RepID=A0AAV6Z9E3_ENGPU|nr:hypothetical protein GDO81_019806 [Engystomops pustulosus]